MPQPDQSADPSPSQSSDIKRLDKLRNMAPALIGSLVTGKPLPAPERRIPAPDVRLTKKEANRLRKRRQRERDKEHAKMVKEAEDREQEKRDEKMVPNAQRTHVTAPDGSVVRAARLVREKGAVGFRRADPLAHIAEEIEGGSKMFTVAHYAAGKRLRDAWDMVGEGIGLGASDWGSIRGPRGTAPTAPAGHGDLVAQVDARRDLEAAATFLGALWPAVREMVLVGRSMTAWAERSGMKREAVPGYLLAALQRLTEWYAPKRENPHPVPIRAIAPGREVYSLEVEGV